MGEFSPVWRLFSLLSFLKMAKVAQNFGQTFFTDQVLD
jgi:hypothetical protein